MNIWAEIKRRWNFLPHPIYGVRLENHTTHMFGSVVVAEILQSYILNLWIVGIVIVVIAIIREVIQIYNEHEVVWVAVFDVWQYQFWIPVECLSQHYYLLFAGAFIIWLAIYVILLLGDDKWFNYIKEKIKGQK